MQSTRASGARFRQRKLSTKHPLQVVKENEIETFAIDEDPQRHIPHFETGVEKAEETEHHLQAVISASAAASLGAKVNQVFIPTPETKSSSIPYDELYPRQFSQPATYIRFSSTVEDCIGSQYNIDEEDDVFLLNFNASKKDGDEKLSEDIFEELMSFFELKSDKNHPFANISNAPVLTLEEAESYFDDPEDETNLSVEARKWAKDVYEHWRSRRLQNENRSLLSNLKYETGADTDDNDAYVCFRRREVRQARKTRGRDAQVTEKLKKLRRELEDARQILMAVNQRERLIKEKLENERKVFEQRSELKKVKVQQGIKGEKGEDEELLVNQRPAPKPRPAKADGQRPPTLRLAGSRTEAVRAAPENDLVQLSDIQEEAAAVAQRSIDEKIAQHRKWNKDWVDRTWEPITPPAEPSAGSGFLPRIEEVGLPTPPASLRSEPSNEQVKDVEMKDADLPTPVSAAQEQGLRTMFRFNSPPPEPGFERPAYRRRYGRNGRLYIEQRKSRTVVQNKGVIGDSDDESDGETVVYPMDCYDTLGISYRASILAPRRTVDATAEHIAQLRRATSSASGDVVMGNGHSTAVHGASHGQAEGGR